MGIFDTAGGRASFARQTLDAFNSGSLAPELELAVVDNLPQLQVSAGGYTGGNLSSGPGSNVIGVQGGTLPNGGSADGLAQWAAENGIPFQDAFHALGGRIPGGSTFSGSDVVGWDGGDVNQEGNRPPLDVLLGIIQGTYHSNAAPYEPANTSVDWSGGGGGNGGGGGFNKPTLIPGSTATYEPMVQFAGNTGQYNQSADPYQWLDAVKQRYPQPEQVFRQPGPILPQNTPSGFSQNTQGPDMPIRQTGLPPAPTQVDNGTAYPQQGGMADNKTRRQKDLLSGFM